MPGGTHNFFQNKHFFHHTIRVTWEKGGNPWSKLSWVVANTEKLNVWCSVFLLPMPSLKIICFKRQHNLKSWSFTILRYKKFEPFFISTFCTPSIFEWVELGKLSSFYIISFRPSIYFYTVRLFSLLYFCYFLLSFNSSYGFSSSSQSLFWWVELGNL